MAYQELFRPQLEDLNNHYELSLEAILRMLENAASNHSASENEDVVEARRSGLVWLLVEWRISILRRPRSAEALRVETWLRGELPARMVFREFVVTDEQSGEVCILASGKVCIFDMHKQSVVMIDSDHYCRFFEGGEAALPEKFALLPEPEQYDGELILPLRRSDMDFNGHVHNTGFIDFALEALPQRVYDSERFGFFRIVYLRPIAPAESITVRYCCGSEDVYTVGIYDLDNTLCALIELK